MSKVDLVWCLLHHYNVKLKFIEKILLEGKLLTRIFHELSEIFQSQHKEYQRLLKTNIEENMEIRFMKELINDILSTKEYTLKGIATYTNIPQDVLYDVAAGINMDPSFDVCRKILEIHISVRPDLYDEIMQKIILEYIDKQNVNSVLNKTLY